MEFDLAKKSKPNQPCNNCGYCCSMSVCGPGAALVYGCMPSFVGQPLNEPCRALVHTAPDIYECGLIKTPNQYVKNGHSEESNRAALKVILLAGTGCNSYEEVKSAKRYKKLKQEWEVMTQKMISPKQFAASWDQIFEK